MIGISLGLNNTRNLSGFGAPAENLGFDPADTGAGIALSNDNKTATCTVSLSSSSTQSVTSHTSSTLRYFELLVDALPITDFRPGISDDIVAGLPGLGNSVAYLPNGNILVNSSTIKAIGSYTAGAVLQFWLKPSTGDFWIGLDDTVDGDPQKELTPTGSLTVATFKAALGPRRLNNAATIRTTSAEFTYSAQGATAWDE